MSNFPPGTFLIKGGKRRSGTPTALNVVGASTSSLRGVFETNPANIIYVNAATGDDTTGDGTSSNPYETLAHAMTVTSSKTVVEWMTSDDAIATNDVVYEARYLQAAVGVSPELDLSSIDSEASDVATFAGLCGFTVNITSANEGRRLKLLVEQAIYCTLHTDDSILFNNATNYFGTVQNDSDFAILQNCRIQNDSDIAAFAPPTTSTKFIARDCLFIDNTMTFGGTSSTGNSAINCTFIATVSSGTGITFAGTWTNCRDNIIIASCNKASAPILTVESGLFRGTAFGEISLSSSVRNDDPLFIDTDYRLQAESGYGGATYAYDSPAIEASKFSTTSAGRPRDLGCYNYDHSTVTEIFTRAFYMSKPTNGGNIVSSPINYGAVDAGITGEYDGYNDIDRRGELLELTIERATRDDIEFLDWIETQQRLNVFIALDTDNVNTQPSVTVSTTTAAGNVVLPVSSAFVASGSAFTAGGVRYYVMYSLNSDNAKTESGAVKLVLDKPLVAQITSSTVLDLTFPVGLGEYVYNMPQTRPLGRWQANDTSYFNNLKLQFVRKKG